MLISVLLLTIAPVIANNCQKRSHDAAAEDTSQSSKRYGQKKYPALFEAVGRVPVGEMTFESKDGALLVHISADEGPVAIWDATSCQSTTSQGGSTEVDLGNLDNRKSKNGYARQRYLAEKEGRLDEFLQKHAKRIAKARHDRSEEEKKHRGKYEYAKKKVDLQALQLIDPIAALKAREEQAEKKRIYNKTYWEKRKKKLERERQEELTGVNDLVPSTSHHDANDEVDAAAITNSDGDTSVRDFDLNDPTSFDTSSFDLNQLAEDDYTIDLNEFAEGAEMSGWSLRKRTISENDTFVDVASSSTPSDSTMSNAPSRQSTLSSLAGQLAAASMNPSQSSSTTATEELEQTKPKTTYYQRRLQKARDKGPEALEALRQRMRDQNRQSYQRTTAETPRDQREYYKYARTMCKHKMAILKETNPEEYERRMAERRLKQNDALRRYREKVKKGLPIKKYHRYKDNVVDRIDEDVVAATIGDDTVQADEGADNAETPSKSSETMPAAFDLNVPALEDEEGFYE